jgi:CcdB protein
MNCHDVVRSRTRDELFVIFQSDFLSHLSTRLVVPIVQMSLYREKPVLRLNPVLRIEDVDYVLTTHLAFSARVSDLRPVDLSAAHEHDKIRDAFDFLMSGF